MILTTKEDQILSLAAAGSKDQTIAKMLGISVRTVQNHMQRIYTKTGTKNRVSAIVMYLNSNVRVVRRTKSIKRRQINELIGAKIIKKDDKSGNFYVSADIR